MRSSDPTQYNPGSYDHEFDSVIDDSIFDAEYPLASPWKRLSAVLIDWCLLVGAFLPGLGVVAFGDGINMEVFEALGAFIVMASIVGVLVYQTILLSRDGQTIGKRILHLRIVDVADSSNPGFVRAVLQRVLVMRALAMFPFVGLIDALMIFTEDHQTIHDRLARTVVEDETRAIN